MMIRLYGLKGSNYYSLVKALLIEMCLDFEEISAPPTQDPDNLRRSPMGKMPSIEVDGRFLSESLAIAEYLERQYPLRTLLPRDAFEAAKAMELVLHITLDVELVARRCLPAAFFGQSASEELKAATLADLERGMAAVQRLLVCAPYAAGATLTLADFYAYYTFTLASAIVQKVFGRDLLAEHDNIRELLGRLSALPSIARVEREKSA